MQARIHFARLGKSEEIYTEGLVRDDGSRLDTCSRVPAEYTRRIWQKDGFLAGKAVHKICKHHFYQEWFDIIELFGQDDALLGYYCDVVTPLEKRGEAYYLQDLCLDLWIAPDKTCQELDWDEFEDAVRRGLVEPACAEMAVETLRRLVNEVKMGIFPEAYLS